MIEVIQAARLNEEKIINDNVFPLNEFERIKDETCEKCIYLKQENDELELDLKKFKKELISKCIIEEKNNDVNCTYFILLFG